jgi:hypothetical protein
MSKSPEPMYMLLQEKKEELHLLMELADQLALKLFLIIWVDPL